jgi:predicted dehydrogenase
MSRKLIHVGVIGAGEVAQLLHLPTLQLLNHLYRIVAVCDLSPKAVGFCTSRHHIPTGTTDPYEVIDSPHIDLIFNLTSDEFHETYTIAALAGKHVMVEKPLSLSLPSAQRIIDAEKKARNGARVFVGYMRRYAPTFVNAFKREVASIDKILYARSRGIVGPNASAIKTTAEDAMQDLILFKMMFEQYDRQQAATHVDLC